MKKSTLFLLLIIIVFFSKSTLSQNNLCQNSVKFCTDSVYNFPAGVNAGTAQAGPDYTCLGTQPNPAWYYFEVSSPGPIIIYMSSTPQVDLDFTLWGPFTNQTTPCTAQLTALSTVDCSYSTSWNETADIPNAQTGEVYILMITNFSNNSCNINFSQTNTSNPGHGTANCGLAAPPIDNNGPLCIGTTLNLNSQNAPIGCTYFWTGPDGFTSTQQSPVIPNVTLAMAGDYFLQVILGADTSNAVSTTVEIFSIPISNFIISTDSVCVNEPITLNYAGTVSSTATYIWDVDGGAPNLITGPGPHIISWGDTGLVNVSLTVDESGCTSSPTNLPVYIKPTPVADAGIDQTISSGSTVNLNGTATGGSGNYSFSWSPSNLLQNANVSNPLTLALTTSTVFTFYVTDNVTACVVSADVQVFVSGGVLSASASANPAAVCPGAQTTLQVLPTGGTGIYSYSWTSIPAGFSSTVQNPTVSPTDTTQYIVQITSDTETALASVTVQLNLLPAVPDLIIGATVVCKGQNAVTYTVPLIENATSYIWTLPYGATGTSSTNSITVNYGTSAFSGNISVGGTNTCGNGAISTLAITVNPIPAVPTVNSPITYEQNVVATPLTATGTNLLWYTSQFGGTGSVTAPIPNTANTGTITYFVSQTINDCESPRVPIVVNVVVPCPTALPSATGASRCGAGSVTLSASGGSDYLWYNSQFGGNIVNVGQIFNTPSLSTTTTYYVSNFDTCESPRVPVIATIINLNIDAGNNQLINCGSSVMLNTTTTYNSTNTLVYAWSPTTGLSSGTIAHPYASPTQTTAYALMVSDGTCSSFDNVTVNVNATAFGLDFSVSPQLINTPPFAVQFNNLTPNLSNYNFTWHFGDGVTLQSNNTVVFHEYAQNGLYDITLEAANTATGCTETMFKDDWIYCAGGNNCTHTASITPAGTISGCVGIPVVLTCNIVPNATYQWNYNGMAISGNNTNCYFASASGNYSVTLIVNNCPVTSYVVTLTLNNPPAVPSITSTGSLTYCGGGSVTLSAPAGASSYLWSDGATTQGTTVTVSGNYTVQVSDANGCITQSLPYLVGASPIGNPDICLVSVDTATGHNLIIWNEPLTTAIEYFNIYGEGTQTNVFNLLGSVDYDSLSIFIDTTSNPLQQAYRYKISAVDTCGAETVQSSYHKTIHLAINQGIGNTYNLIWSYYEGFTFSSYKIYRGTSPSNMTLLTTIANTLNSYTDLTPPTGNVYYQIEALNPNTCTPSKISYYSTKSNIATNVPEIIYGIGITNVDYNFEIYPNPANKTITVTFNTNYKVNTLEIINTLGQTVYAKQIMVPNKSEQLDISGLQPGVYFIKAQTDKGCIIEKMVKDTN